MDRRTFIQVTPAALAAAGLAGCSGTTTTGVSNLEQTITAIADWVQKQVASTCAFIPNVQTILGVVQADFPNILVSGATTIAETALAAVAATICKNYTPPTPSGPTTVTAGAPLNVTTKSGAAVPLHGYAWDAKTGKFVAF